LEEVVGVKNIHGAYEQGSEDFMIAFNLLEALLGDGECLDPRDLDEYRNNPFSGDLGQAWTDGWDRELARRFIPYD
jgi:hypothetical protein